MWAQDARPGSSAGKPCAEYVCYLCNEQFDSQTLQMHVPACQKRWENEQLKLNPSLRKPLPPVPAEMKKGAEGLPTVTIEVQAFNSKMEVRGVCSLPHAESSMQRLVPATLFRQLTR